MNNDFVKKIKVKFRKGKTIIKNKLVDYAKGYSMSAIVLFHLIFYYLNVSDIIRLGSSFGGAGVHIFLICSGFGLYYSQLKHPLVFKKFIIKRFKRIYIPYVFIIIISFLVPFMYSGKNRVLALLSHVLLFKMFVPSFEGSFGVQMWFISTIIQFYLIFLPVCHLKERMENNQFIILSILLSLIWATIITTLNKVDNRVWNSFFVQYFWEFSIGMCLGEYFKNKQHEYFTRFHYLTLIIVFGISFCIYAIMALKYVEWRAFNDAFGVTAFGSLMLILYKLGF